MMWYPNGLSSSISVGKCLVGFLVAVLLVAPQPTNAKKLTKKPISRAKKVKHRSFSSGFKMLQVGASIKADPSIESLIKPYRRRLQQKMAEVLTRVRWNFTRRRPESSLGNLVADLCLARLRYQGIQADLFLSNLGGIRNDLSKGKITLGDIFEILPFENKIVVLKVRGTLLKKMLQPIVRKGGEPTSGVRLWIDRRKKALVKILVNGKPILPGKFYYVGTSDYLSRTGWLAPFHKGKPWLKTTIMLRDAVVWGLRYNLTPLWTPIEGRIQYVGKKNVEKTSSKKVRKGASKVYQR